MTCILFCVTLNVAQFESQEKPFGSTSVVKWNDLGQILLTFQVFQNYQMNTFPFYLPINYNESVGAFVIRHNKLTKQLPIEVTETFPNLIAYTVKNCSLTFIEKPYFRNMSKLKLLILSHNPINNIVHGSFDDLVELEILLLTSNRIFLLFDDSFKNLRKLKNLNLNHNELMTIEFKFDTLVELQNFTMAHNQLTKLPDHPFDYNTKLEKVRFDSNNIRFINQIFFDGLNNLKLVNLAYNTCINSTYHTGEFEAMKEKIISDCSYGRFINHY